MGRGDSWTRPEVELAVADYLEMLLLELNGKAYNKSLTRRELRSRLDSSRTEGSIERKRMNISAALLDIGLPCIDGYKPYSNYQAMLSDVVDEIIVADPRVRAVLDRKATEHIEIPVVDDILAAMEDAPEKKKAAEVSVRDAVSRVSPLGVNYLDLDARNSALGDAGEEFCFRYEKARLIRAGAGSLADRIEHVAKSIGPSAGYDIRSYETNGQDRFIEVKTTRYGKRTPFYISPNEVRFSACNERRYSLYRVFRFSLRPGIFRLPGQVTDTCELAPSQWKATLK